MAPYPAGAVEAATACCSLTVYFPSPSTPVITLITMIRIIIRMTAAPAMIPISNGFFIPDPVPLMISGSGFGAGLSTSFPQFGQNFISSATSLPQFVQNISSPFCHKILRSAQDDTSRMPRYHSKSASCVVRSA